ncbi:MAG TPA: hypothetical protein VFY83_09215 [Anaerolineales bacterium]|nr:hypothetical protein [Anaerolineales bacterium]
MKTELSDIAWHNDVSHDTQIWFMNGHRIANRLNVVDESGATILIGPPWGIVGVGEFNPVSAPDLGTLGSGGVMPPFNPSQLPETVTFDSGSITTGLSIGGFARLVMSQTGHFTFTGHMHNSGALGIDFLLTFVVMTPSGIAYTMQRSGHTAGTFTSGSRDDDWIISDFNAGIRDNWDQASQARLTWTMHANDTLTPQIGKVLEETLQEALKAAGQAAVKAVISLL